MTFFESLLALLLAAIVLLQVSRRLSLPYPAMLAAAGVAVALIPGSPAISIEPDTALALFIAPAVMDSAYDFPPVAARRFWAPLLAFAVFAVVATALVVGWIGWTFGGFSLAAALALGAIVAPPDAAAATAVLSAVSIPRNTNAVLKGESLFNDATALLLFSGALTVLSHGSMSVGVGLRLAFAVPGGLLLGILVAYITRPVNNFVKNTLGGNLLQFVISFLVWILAQHLRVSAVLCTIALAMTIARRSDLNGWTRMRVHSFAVWSAVVFTLNVFAFLLMGLQGRTIISRMPPGYLPGALRFAGLVVFAVIVVRLILVISFNRAVTWWRKVHGKPEPASVGQALFAGWSGMRGFVTLATAFALPTDFPHRDLALLTAFSVVLATLVLQGLTLAPLIRVLKLDQQEVSRRELAQARLNLANVALGSLEDHAGPEADHLKYSYTIQREASKEAARSHPLKRRRALGLAAISAERTELEHMRNDDQIGPETYLLLQEELDWSELTLLCDDERRIQES